MTTEQSIREYVELEARENVVSVELAATIAFRDEWEVYRVTTTDGAWWVIPSPAMNLYRVIDSGSSSFSTADEAFSFHLGLTMRLATREANGGER